MRAKDARTFDIVYVRANLGKLIGALKPREWFIITVDGKPKAKVVALTDKQKEALAKQKT
ncbi:MAG: hypothetical protein WBE38_21135 [Terracidiphilus sp.]|jgi:antitoxin (DNA-binding transcriptional repressor) of toxin-antitoxin stability system